MENIRRIDFETYCCNSDGKPIENTETAHTIIISILL
jgi:hypothetical protein